MYTNSLLSFDDIVNSIETVAGKPKTFSSKEVTTIPDLRNEPGAVLIFLEETDLKDNLKVLEVLDTQRRGNSISIFIGYGNESRLLQEDTEDDNPVTDEKSNEKVNATAVGALTISLMTGLLAAFGLIMMSKIQTPQAFADKDLIKGSINK